MELTELNKYKNKLFNLAVIIFALMVAGNIYKKQAKDIEALRGAKGTEIKKNALLANIGQLEKKINAYKKIFVKKDANLVINTIGNIAKELGIQVVSIKPVGELAYPAYLKLSFDAVISAPGYHALGRFMSRVESWQGIYVIEAVEIKSQTETGALTVNLRLSNLVTLD
ncbi:MAG: type 4a pilus biogenesis protein PilO [Candidatus Omnitrophota bacterium]|nr:type 4a pilus biogenesis protein PilO [Candidatus Omnitrophota bacterium]